MKKTNTKVLHKDIIPNNVLEEINFDWLSVAVQKQLIDAFKAKPILDDWIIETTDPEKKAYVLRMKIHDIAKTIWYKQFIQSFIKTFKSMVKSWERETIEYHSDEEYDYIDFSLWWDFQLKIREDSFWNTNAVLWIDPYSLQDVREKIDSFEWIIAILHKMKNRKKS